MTWRTLATVLTIFVPRAALAQNTPAPGGGAPLADIHDIKPILDMGRDWRWLLWAAAALALLGLALWAWRRWRKPRPAMDAPAAAPPVAPDREALLGLEALAGEDLAARPFYFRLSALLRHYIERRYGFPAEEMTTEELLPRLPRVCPQPWDEAFTAFCRRSDPVKFAAMSVDGWDKVRELAFARDFVEATTRAALAPPPETRAETRPPGQERARNPAGDPEPQAER